MGIKDKILGFVSPEDEDEDYVDDEDDVEEYVAPKPARKRISSYEGSSEKTANTVSADTKMVLFEPRGFEEAEEIARHLKQRRAAVVNLHKLQRDYAQRTIDFLTGVVFALDGRIQKIGHNVILCSPKSIGVEGEISLDNADD